MKKIKLILIMIILLLSLCNLSSKKNKKDEMAPYQKDTYITIKGKITSVDIVNNKFKDEEGLHLTVKTELEEYIVHVCPKWHADQKEINFQINDEITVSGSSFIKDDKQNIYAAVIIMPSSKELNLRDPDTGDVLWKKRYKKFRKKKCNKEKE